MDEKDHERKKKSSMAVGLRILIQVPQGNSNNIVAKSTLKWRKPFLQVNRIITHEYSDFLKSCFLCKKNLSPDKDVFMYRGDQGFCSMECRDRQIYLDEMREIEISTKKLLKSFRRCGNNSGGKRETSVLHGEIGHRHKSISRRVIFS